MKVGPPKTGKGTFADRQKRIHDNAAILHGLVQRAQIIGQDLPQSWHDDARAVLNAIAGDDT